MASVKILFFKQKKFNDGTSPIVLQIIHKRIRRIISLNYNTTIDRWDDKEKQIKIFNKAERNLIQMKNLHIQEMRSKANRIIVKLETKGTPFTADDIIQELKGTESSTFLKFTEKTIDELKARGKAGNARAYKGNFGIVKKFLNDKDISFDQINFKWLKKFETWLCANGNSTNGVSFHMRTLRAIYNRGIKEGVAKKEVYPFNDYSISNAKTQKRALSKEEIIKIRDLDLTGKPAQERARDLFMFSFYCMGMSFVDVAHLKVSNIRNERLNYSRQKTAQTYNMALVAPAMEIIRKYSDLSDPDSFVFPILDPAHPNTHRQYLSQMQKNNHKLKEVGQALELSIPLTTYVARHSWATIAKRSGIPTAVISEGLGHTTEKTTQIYLDSFENDVLDQANRIVTL